MTKRQAVAVLMNSPFWFSGIFTQKDKLACVKILMREFNNVES